MSKNSYEHILIHFFYFLFFNFFFYFFLFLLLYIFYDNLCKCNGCIIAQLLI